MKRLNRTATAHSPEKRWGTQSIQRVTQILREVAVHNRRGLSTTEIAEIVHLSYPTAHRLVQALIVESFLQKNQKTKCYVLGHVAYELGLTAQWHCDLHSICKPILRHIADQTGDSVFLMIKSGLDTVCIDRIDGRFATERLILDVGSRRPLGIGAASIAILSLLPVQEVSQIISKNASRVRQHDTIDVSSLRRMIQRARKLGYAVREGPVSGARALSIPIRSHRDGKQLAAISISAIRSRLDARRQRELVTMMREQTRTLPW